MSNFNGGKGSSWEPLEPFFQLVLPVLFGDRLPQSAIEDESLRRIRLALVAAAYRIFRSPRMRLRLRSAGCRAGLVHRHPQPGAATIAAGLSTSTRTSL